MDEGIQYLIEMRDGLSRPSNDAKAALSALKGEMAETSAAIRDLQERQLRYREAGMSGVASQAGIEISKLRLHLKDLTAEHKELAASGKEAGGFLKDFTDHMIPQVALGQLAAEGIKKLAESFVELGKAVIDVGIEGIKFAAEASEFKESMTEAYGIVYDTREEGEAAFRDIDNMARSLHVPTEVAHRTAQELMLSGLEQADLLKGAVGAISSLERVGLAGGAQKLKRIIEQSESVGHFQLPKKLAGLGISVDAIINDLATKLHKPTEQIRAELKAGKIATEEGVAAIVTEINAGKIGEIASKKFTLGDAATDLKNSFRAMFQDVDASPLTNALRDLVGIFDANSASGKEMRTEIVGAFNDIMKWVGRAVDDVTIFALRFEIGFLEAKVASAPLIHDLEKMTSKTDLLGMLADGAEHLGYGLVRAAVAGAWLIMEFEKMATAPYRAGVAIGESLADGIAGGISSGAVTVAHAATELGKGAIEAVKGVLQIHSPSAIMAEMGEQTTAGFAAGVEGGAGRTQGAMAMAVQPPALAPAQGGGTARGFDVGGIHIQITGVQKAEEMGPLLESAITDALERLMLESGG